MNDKCCKSTCRLDRIEQEMRRHESLLSKIIRVIAPLRRKRRRITRPSIKLGHEDAASLRAEMLAHGIDDDSTVDTRKRRA